MNMLKKYLYFGLLSVFVLAYALFYFKAVSPIGIQTFPDTDGYILLRSSPAKSVFDFLQKILFYRPSTVPFLFWLLGSNSNIASGQVIFYLFSWVILAFTFTLVVKRYWLKILSFIAILMFSMSTNLFFWPKIILSEAFYISFFALSLSIFIVLEKLLSGNFSRWIKIAAAIVCFLVMALFSHTKDLCMAVSVFLFLPLLAVLAFMNYCKNREKSVFYICIGGAILLNIAAQTIFMNKGERYNFSFVNIVAQRVLPDSERADWFVENGMPNNENVMRFSGKWASDFGADWSGFEDFLGSKGRFVYTKFLLLNPGYTVQSLIQNWDEVMDSSLYMYSLSNEPGQDSGQIKLDKIIWGRGTFLVVLYSLVLILNILALIIKKASMRQDSVLLALFLLISAIPLSFACYHGDPMEISRHCLPAQIHMRLGIILGIAVFLDNYFDRKKFNPGF
jgi:hypothetical protein